MDLASSLKARTIRPGDLFAGPELRLLNYAGPEKVVAFKVKAVGL